MASYEPAAITTHCPRCGSPLRWAVRDPDGDVVAPGVPDRGCDCELADEQWATLFRQAATLACWAGEAGTRTVWAMEGDGAPAWSRAAMETWWDIRLTEPPGATPAVGASER